MTVLSDALNKASTDLTTAATNLTALAAKSSLDDIVAATATFNAQADATARAAMAIKSVADRSAALTTAQGALERAAYALYTADVDAGLTGASLTTIVTKATSDAAAATAAARDARAAAAGDVSTFLGMPLWVIYVIIAIMVALIAYFIL